MLGRCCDRDNHGQGRMCRSMSCFDLHNALTDVHPTLQAAVSALMNVRTLFRGDLYTIAALDGHTRDHLEVGVAEILPHLI